MKSDNYNWVDWSGYIRNKIKEQKILRHYASKTINPKYYGTVTFQNPCNEIPLETKKIETDPIKILMKKIGYEII
jgi:hypothetical protein